jgi:hypothetical protein
MNKDFNIKDLDKTTLEFAIEKAWGFGMLCKNTKEGRIKAQAYNQIKDNLQYFLDEINKNN